MWPKYVVAVACVLASATRLYGQTATAMKTGENTVGQSKECYYEHLGKQYVKTMQSFEFCPYSIQVRTGPPPIVSSSDDKDEELPTGPMAFKTGENTTGTTKQCFYEFAGTQYTTTVQSYALCPLSIRVSTARPNRAPTYAPAAPPRPATFTAFKTGERTTGMTKQCYYAFGSNAYTKTVQSFELCPLSIQVRAY